VRYDDCSNGALIFEPATGTDVTNGIITVNTGENLNGMGWKSCGNIATEGASGISRDHTMVICPDVVDFGGTSAWGSSPGSYTWYKSMYASIPEVQMHEIGHNLGHHHSGKDGVTYGDPTCVMGGYGSWSDEGINYCFNAAKTWANKWYESYHVTIDPTGETHDGTLVGINAVKDGTIAEAGQDVVLKIASSGETDLYVMFNRKAGANNEVIQYGDQVVITEQYRETGASSFWQASLSSGEEYTQSNWGASGTLTVKVCSLETGSPGSARVLVYATGHATLSCDFNSSYTNSPTVATDVSPTVAPAPAFVGAGCQDIASKFSWNGKDRNCKFVARKHYSNRCLIEALAEFCPVTCRKQSQCTCYNTGGSFQMPNGKNQRSCRWAKNKPFLAEKRCRNNFIRSNCPIACGVCQG